MNLLAGYEIVTIIHESANVVVARVKRPLEQDDGGNGELETLIVKALSHPHPPLSAVAELHREYQLNRMVSADQVCDARGIVEHVHASALVFEDIGGTALNMRWGGEALGEALHVAIEVVKGIEQIHAAGIIHGGISLENIVYNPTTRAVQIIDFGAATTLPMMHLDFTHPSRLAGNVAFMSPEQTSRMNRPIDYRTDFYSLGVVLYALFTGKLPFTGDRAASVILGHIDREPLPPHEVDRRVTPALSNIVCKLLSKAAEDRYQSAYGLRYDLQRCLELVRVNDAATVFELGTQDPSNRFEFAYDATNHPTQRRRYAQKMYTAFAEVQHGKRALTIMWGPSGVGKSTIARSLYRPVTIADGYFATGQFRPPPYQRPYGALAAICQQLLMQIAEDDGSVTQAWKERILEALGKHVHIVAEISPDISAIINETIHGTLGTQAPVRGYAHAELQSLVIYAVNAFVQLFCDPQHPVVMVLDEVQWADPDSMTVLLSLLCNKQIRGLLLVMCSRDNIADNPAMWAHWQQRLERAQVPVEFLEIPPLNVDDITSLLAHIGGASSTHAMTLAETIRQRTGGNPVAVERLLHQMHREGQVYFDLVDKAWKYHPDEIGTDSVPIVGTDADANADANTGASADAHAGALGRAKQENQRVPTEAADAYTQHLPLATQHLLCLASCIGCEWELTMLAQLSAQSLRGAYRALLPAIHEGLVCAISPQWMPLSSATTPPSQLAMPLLESPTSRSQPHLALAAGIHPTPSLRANVADTADAADGETHPMTDFGAAALVTERYAFAHDYIRDLCQSLLTDAEISQTHWQIGRAFLSDGASESRKTHLFDVVDHRNRGVVYLDAPTMKIWLANLNLSAARRAESLASYHIAQNYVAFACELFVDEDWSHHGDLLHELYRVRARCASLLGEIELAEELFGQLLGRAQSKYDRAEIYIDRVTLATRQYRDEAALGYARTGLLEFGISLPRLPREQDNRPVSSAVRVEASNNVEWAHVAAAERAQVYAHVSRGSLADLSSRPVLPSAANDDAEVVERILHALIPSLARLSSDVLEWAVARLLNIGFRHGTTPSSAIACAYWGMIAIRRGAEPAQAVAACEVGLRLIERHSWDEVRGEVLYIYAKYVSHWAYGYAHEIQALEDARTYAVSSGAMLHAVMSARLLPSYHLCRGSTIVRIVQASEAYEQLATVSGWTPSGGGSTALSRFLHRLTHRDEQAGASMLGLGNVQGPRAGTGDDERRDDQQTDGRLGFDLSQLEADLYHIFYLYMVSEYGDALRVVEASGSIFHARGDRTEAREPVGDGFVPDADRNTDCVMDGAADGAADGAVDGLVAGLVDCDVANIVFPEYLFYAGLVYAALADTRICDRTGTSFAVIPWQLEYCAERMRKWARDCPDNYLHKSRLIDGEIARIGGDFTRALDCYDQALSHASKQGDSLREALAHELVGRFWRIHGQAPFARVHLSKACECFHQWGASFKVWRLVSRYSLPLEQAAARAGDHIHVSVTETTTSERSVLDLATVTKASQAISTEIRLSELIARLMHVVIENAGAERGVLMLLRGQALWIEAEVSIDASDVELRPRPLNAQEPVPATIINYVRRSRSAVILNQTGAAEIYSHDPYIRRSHPKSIFCIPIVKNDRLTGILFLENNLVENAFTRDRSQLLELLCTQAAISIENALLYRQIEEQVAKQTQELKAVSRKLQETIAERKEIQAEHDSIHNALYNTARHAGMVEIATRVIHSIGKPLERARQSVEELIQQLAKLEIAPISEFADTLAKHRHRLDPTRDTGTGVTNWGDDLMRLSRDLERQRKLNVHEIRRLSQQFANIQESLSWQQAYTGVTNAKELIDPPKLAQDALLLTKDAFAEHGIVVDVDVRETAKIVCEHHKVVQILVNILLNACDAVVAAKKERGTVLFTLDQPTPGCVRYQIYDNGIGIAAQHLKEIYRFGFTTKEKGHGSGLHISSLLAKEIGGELTAMSEGIGSGAVFSLELPVVATEGE